MTHELKREGEGKGGGEEREKGRRGEGRRGGREKGRRGEEVAERRREEKGRRGGRKGDRENERMRAKTDCHTKCMYTLLKKTFMGTSMHVHKKMSNCRPKKVHVYMEFKNVYMCTHWQAHSSVKQIWDKKQYMHNNLI